MASNLNFDELHVLGSETTTKRKAIPYDEYFDEMAISYEQKKERIELAEMLDDVFFYAFALATTMKDERNNIAKLERLNSALEESLRDTMQEYGIRFDKDAYWGNYASKKAYEIARATVNHSNDNYYTSDDRAKIIAENEANAIMNHQEFQDAKNAGYTSKIWVSMGDSYVRYTHAEADGQEVAIDEPFMIGASLMMYPMDDSLGADDTEIVGCRCSLDFGNKFDKILDEAKAIKYEEENIEYKNVSGGLNTTEMVQYLLSTDIGRELAQFAIDNNIKIEIDYKPRSNKDVGLADIPNKSFKIYACNISDNFEASGAIVHEITHIKLGEPNTLEKEFWCYKNQFAHMGYKATDEQIWDFVRVNYGR